MCSLKFFAEDVYYVLCVVLLNPYGINRAQIHLTGFGGLAK